MTNRWAGMAAVFVVLAMGFCVQIGAQAQTASEFYKNYRVAFDKATQIEDLLPYMSRKTRSQVDATPKAERPQMFELLKMMGTLTEMKIVKEAPTKGGVTLSVQGLDGDRQKTTGTVEVLKEDGGWKLGNESWSSSAGSN